MQETKRAHHAGEKNAARGGIPENLEARAGVEPTYMDLQSSA